MGNIGAASYDLTNSTLQVSENETIGGFEFPAIFIQDGGTNMGGNLFLESSSEYDFYGGNFVCFVFFNGGVFNQWGGNINDLDGPWQGQYNLAGGTLTTGGLGLPSGGYYGEGGFNSLQTGGTNIVGGIALGGAGRGTYTLTNGTLMASSLDVGIFESPIDVYSDSGNTFIQSGGYHTNGAVSINGLNNGYYGVFLSYYQLSGGTLATPSISVNVRQFAQSEGTNDEGVISFNDDAANFNENNGSAYVFSGGELIAGTVSLTGATFVHSGGALGSPTVIILTNGVWNEETNGAQLGQLQLGAGSNSIISFSTGSSVLQFTDSSGVPWATNGLLTVKNWNGSLYGGGQQQLVFGDSQTALTTQQLAEVQFQSPAGLASGTYPARILADGEVVPDSGSSLPPNIELLSGRSNGAFSMAVQGNAGQNYELDASTDLAHWVTMSTQSNSTGTVNFSDNGASNYPQRFYRARASD